LKDKRAFVTEIYNAAASESSIELPDSVNDEDLREKDKHFLQLDGKTIEDKIVDNFKPTKASAEDNEEITETKSSVVSSTKVWQVAQGKLLRKKRRFQEDEYGAVRREENDCGNKELQEARAELVAAPELDPQKLTRKQYELLASRAYDEFFFQMLEEDDDSFRRQKAALEKQGISMPEILVGVADTPADFEDEYGFNLETLNKRIEERRAEKEFGLTSILADDTTKKEKRISRRQLDRVQQLMKSVTQKGARKDGEVPRQLGMQDL
jgi:hypothetical protein